MPTFDTAEIDESFAYPEQLYNTQDSCMTLEVLDELLGLRQPPLVYNFSRALQGPFLEMALRGFKVDLAERARAHSLLLERERWLRSYLDEIAHAVWDKGLNPQSPKQVLSFLTKALRFPELWTSKKGVRKLSSDRETLEKYDAYIYARPFVQAILAIRDAKKERERLEEPLRNGRYHTSFNIAATNTFRLSSDKAADGTGGNIQNPKRDDDIDHQLGDGSYELSVRKQFIADDGKILVSIDREQSESREVGFTLGKLFDDWSYLDATESGDLHTLVCRYNWSSELEWTDDPKANRKLADQLFYRNYSYRDMAKKLGHGSNYMGQPYTMARHSKCPIKMVERFQARYFAQFPGIPKWHRWVAEQIQTKGFLKNLFDVERQFFGRPSDDDTLRKAIAFGPQSSTAFRTNLGLLRIWYEMRDVELLVQRHDSVVFQCDYDSKLGERIQRALDLTEVWLTHNGRRFSVPGDVKVGFNDGKFHEKLNPNGLSKWKGSETRIRIPEGDLRAEIML